MKYIKMVNRPTLVYNTKMYNIQFQNIYKVIRKIVGILLRTPKKVYKRILLKRNLRMRHGSLLLQNVVEINLLMEGRAFLHDLEIPLLAKYAREAESMIVEIGCAFGASSAIFLAHVGEKTIVTSIDPFIVDSMATFQATKEKCIRNVTRILKALGQTHKIKQWELNTDYSYNIVDTWTNPIDVLFIDGDHRYEAVAKDFNDWLPHVKKGGYILFHDSRKEAGTPKDTFNRGWEGPTRLAKELLSDTRVKLVDEVFSITVWEKTI